MNLKGFAALVLFAGLMIPEVFGCRYSVRDAGFVDLGGSTYYLYLFSDELTRDRLPSTVRAYAALVDSNIKVESIDTGAAKPHPAMKVLDELGIAHPPAAVLVAPGGRPMAVPFSSDSPLETEHAWTVLEGLVSSPVRERILENILDAFCVVVMVEGDSKEANDAAKEAARKAIERIEGMMPLMPKPVKEPPRLITVPFDGIAAEKALLFGLGLDEEHIGQPHAAVLYGRGRAIGPLLRGETIQEKFLYNIMLIIGADCECDLDRAWLQGTMIPMRWDEPRQERAAKMLDFDPENPMVKMEVSRIVSAGPGSFRNRFRLDDPFEEDVLFGYQEEAVPFEPAGDGVPTAQEEPKAPVERTEPAPGSAGDPEEADYYGTISTVVAILVVMLAGALLVAIRANKKAR
jgi:hypothetical protein